MGHVIYMARFGRLAASRMEFHARASTATQFFKRGCNKRALTKPLFNS